MIRPLHPKNEVPKTAIYQDRIRRYVIKKHLQVIRIIRIIRIDNFLTYVILRSKIKQYERGEIKKCQ